MDCSIRDCPGVYEQRKIAYVAQQGNRRVVIDHMPAEVCSVCGDVLFTPEAVRRIEALRQTTASPEQTDATVQFH